MEVRYSFQSLYTDILFESRANFEILKEEKATEKQLKKDSYERARTD